MLRFIDDPVPMACIQSVASGRREEPGVWRLVKKTVVDHELDVFDARRGVLELALNMGFNRNQAHYFVTAVTELANNVVFHSHGGWISIHQLFQKGVSGEITSTGISVTARDQGPGIENVSLAMQEGFSTIGSLGCGLPGVERLMDTLTVESSPSGTRVTATLWRECANES